MTYGLRPQPVSLAPAVQVTLVQAPEQPQPVYLPIIDSRYADCSVCSLDTRRREGHTILAEIGPKYQLGGLMFVGEAPGAHEVTQRKPFVGAAGRVLDLLFQVVGIDRSTVILSNAILCRPEDNKIDSAPFSVERCSNRLLEEIWNYRPRVIVALGNHAVRSLVGKVVIREKKEPGRCPDCNGQGSLALKDAVWMSEVTRLRRARGYANGENEVIPCKHCKGKGQRNIKREQGSITADRGIMDYAGAIIGVHDDPQFEHLDKLLPPETQYIIPTYHPSFLMRQKDKKKGTPEGTYFLPYAARHLRRAIRLLREAPVNRLAPFILEAAHPAAPQELEKFLAPAANLVFSVDIETEPMANAVSLPHVWEETEMDDGTRFIACSACGIGQAPDAPEECSDALAEEAPEARLRTDPLQEALVCVGIGRSDSDEVCVLDTRNVPVSHPTMAVLQEFLGDPTRIKTFHNGAFDTAVLEARFSGLESQPIEVVLSSREPVFRVRGYTQDTMILSKNIWPSISKGSKEEAVGIPLDWVAHTYTDCRPWKPKQKAAKKKGGRPIFTSFEELATYNAKDVHHTLEALYALWDEAEAEGVRPDQVAVDIQLQQVAVDMQRTGLPIDASRIEQIESTCRELISGHANRFALLAGKPLFGPDAADGLKLDSPQQLETILFDEWQLPATRFTSKGRRSTAFDVLQQLRSRHEGVDALLEIRRLGQVLKLISSWKSLVRDGFLHPSWRAAATISGRFTSKPNCFDGATEILTETGWVRFDQLMSWRARRVETLRQRGLLSALDDSGWPLLVAQWDPHSYAPPSQSGFSWVAPTAYVEQQENGTMVHLEGPRTDLLVTGDHRCLLRTAAGANHVMPASEYPQEGPWQQPFIEEPTDRPQTWLLRQTPVTCIKKTLVPVVARTVYCVSVPSGFIVVRRNGKISVTGQSQNWPSNIKGVGNMRSIVKAPPGWVLCGSDYSALEQRIMGALTGEKLYRFVNKPDDDSRKYDPTYDCHSHVCAHVFGSRFSNPELFFSEQEMLKYQNDPEAFAKAIANQKKVLRNDTKRVVYARNYGSGIDTIWDIVKEEDPNCPRGKIEQIVRAYDELFPENPRYRDRMLAQAMTKRELRSAILGRRKKWPYGEISPTEAANVPIQSTAADIVNLRTLELLKVLPLDCHLILHGHDSLTVLCPESKGELVKQTMNEVLPCTFDLGYGPMFFDAQAQIGESWDKT